MPENPRLSSLGMNGILSKRSGGFFRHGLAWAKVMPGRPAFQKPWALAQGGSFLTLFPDIQSFYHPRYFLSCLILNINRKLRKIFLTFRSIIHYFFDLFLINQ